MNRIRVLPPVLLAGLFACTGAQAQGEAESYHPLLTDRFSLTLGAFFPSEGVELELGVDDSIAGDRIDFEDALGVDESDTIFTGELRWRFGEKWSVWGQYWDSDLSGGRVLEEDITWRDLTLEAGSNVEAGVGITVGRVFFGRDFYDAGGQEFGLGVGFHWLDLSAYVIGEIGVNEEEFTIERRDADVGAPLPNIGAWFLSSLTPRWAIYARLDWFGASFDEYDGDLWNIGVGVNWQAAEHVGVGLSYTHFELDVDIDSSNWHGGAKVEEHGPVLSVSFNW